MASRKGQRGFGAVEIILVIFIVGLIGVGGWYVWQANNKSVGQTQVGNSYTQHDKVSEQPKLTNTFNNSLVPFTFEYPKEWNVEVDERIKGGQPLPGQYSIELRTPDAVLKEGPIGGTFISKGARIVVLSSVTNLSNIQDKFSGFYAHANDKKDTKVAGLKAVEYSFAYESDPGIFVDFIKDDREYSIGFYAEGSESGSQYLSAHKTLVSSFKFK